MQLSLHGATVTLEYPCSHFPGSLLANGSSKTCSSVSHQQGKTPVTPSQRAVTKITKKGKGRLKSYFLYTVNYGRTVLDCYGWSNNERRQAIISHTHSLSWHKSYYVSHWVSSSGQPYSPMSAVTNLTTDLGDDVCAGARWPVVMQHTMATGQCVYDSVYEG